MVETTPATSKPQCPHCGKEVPYLHNFCKVEVKYRMTVKDGYAEYETMNQYPCDDNSGEYECPECEKVIMSDEEVAVAFLIGEVGACKQCEHYTARAEMEKERAAHEIPDDFVIPPDCKGVCEEGGFTEVGDDTKIQSKEYCNAWRRRKA